MYNDENPFWKWEEDSEIAWIEKGGSELRHWEKFLKVSPKNMN